LQEEPELFIDQPQPIPSTSREEPQVINRSVEDVRTIRRLKKKLRLLGEDPLASLILEHRHELRDFSDESTFEFFDDHVRNFQRKRRGKQYSEKNWHPSCFMVLTVIGSYRIF